LLAYYQDKQASKQAGFCLLISKSKQNNESKSRKSTRSTVVCKAKVISYEDIVEAQAKRDAKEAAVVKGKRGRKRKATAPEQTQAKRTRKNEMEVAEGIIEAEGMGSYCSVLRFS
jgi:hypothetical protein